MYLRLETRMHLEPMFVVSQNYYVGPLALVLTVAVASIHWSCWALVGPRWLLLAFVGPCWPAFARKYMKI
jgi:hypothetical protein